MKGIIDTSMRNHFYYRIFAELLPKFLKEKKAVLQNKKVSGYILYVLLFSLVLLTGYGVYFVRQLYTMYQFQISQVTQAEESFTYWETVAREHENFPQAYYKAAFYAMQLGKRKVAVAYLNRALSLDPGFEEAQRLKEVVTR